MTLVRVGFVTGPAANPTNSESAYTESESESDRSLDLKGRTGSKEEPMEVTKEDDNESKSSDHSFNFLNSAATALSSSSSKRPYWVCNFHVLSDLLLIYIFKLQVPVDKWHLDEREVVAFEVTRLQVNQITLCLSILTSAILISNR